MSTNIDSTDTPTVVHLTRPIQHGSETITDFEFVEVRAEHFEEMTISLEKATFKDMFGIIARLTGQPMRVIRQLHPKDMMACVEVIASFLQ